VPTSVGYVQLVGPFIVTRQPHGMKDHEVAKLESSFEELHKMLEQIKAFVLVSKNTLRQ